MDNNNTIIDQIRSDLQSASEAARSLFEASAILIEGKTGFSRQKMGDNGKGAVYVYYDEAMQAIYVGQTSRHVKARLYDQTSPHQKKTWWQGWKTMRFLPLNLVEDRLVLETLLIISYLPTYNVKPGKIVVENLLSQLNKPIP